MSRLTVQVRELRVLWLNLLRVYFDVALQEAVPPILTFILFQSDLQRTFITISLDAPEGLINMNLLAPFADQNRLRRVGFHLDMHVVDTEFHI